MFKVTKYPHGTLSWADGSSSDQAAARAFYSGVMGWQYEDRPMGDGQVYTMFKKDGSFVAGLGPLPEEMQQAGVPSTWNSYVTVDDVDPMPEKIKAAGGTVVLEPMDVFESGRMMVLQDPGGAHLSLWQPRNHIGAELVNTVGAMCWNELNTRELEKVKPFYADVLGWEFEKMPDMEYYIIKNNGRTNGGLLVMDEQWGDMPSHWMVYFNVADLTAAAQKVKELGGKVVQEPVDTTAGKFIVIVDPGGAACSLIQAASADAWIE